MDDSPLLVNGNFSIFLPFTKTEEQSDGTLMVWGRATEEIPDSDGEIMDYESSVPFWQKSIQQYQDLSSGRALMPLRAMHQPIAAGKVVEVDFKPEAKAIDVAAHVVDVNEVKKVKEHVYNGLSVGGKYVPGKRMRDTKNPQFIRYTGNPREISLVDQPAVPTAKLTLFKLEDDMLFGGEAAPAWVKEFIDAVHSAEALTKAAQDEKDKQEKKLKALGERVGIKRREGSPLTPPKDYPEDPSEYGDPANFGLPADESRATVAVGRFNGGQGREQYSPRERNILGRRVASLASRFGDKYSYDPASKQIERKEKTMNDKVTITKLDVGGLLRQMKAARDTAADLIGKDPTAAKDALNVLMGHLDELADLGSAMTGTSVPATDPGTAIKADGTPSTPSSPSSPSTAATPSATATTPTAAKADDLPTNPPSPSSPPAPSTPTTEPVVPSRAPAAAIKTDDTEAYKTDMADVKKQLAEANDKIEKLAAGANQLLEALKGKVLAKVAGESPVGDLNALVTKKTETPAFDDPIIQALMEGGPYAYVKALKAAGGGDENMPGAMAIEAINQRIQKASFESLEQGGVITKARYVGRIYGPQAQ